MCVPAFTSHTLTWFRPMCLALPGTQVSKTQLCKLPCGLRKQAMRVENEWVSPQGTKRSSVFFFLLAENPWVSPPSLQTFRNRFCDWSGVGILGARHFLVSRLRALQAPEKQSPLGKERIDNTQGEACSLPHLILGNCSTRQKGQHGPWSRSLPSSGKPELCSRA